MNTSLLLPARRTPSGVALVIVLSMLVLLSALVVAFLTTATNERAATAANAGVTRARQIADSTTSLVISQIRDATTQPDSSGKPDEAVTWASQPGAITTFSGAISGLTSLKSDGSNFDRYSPGSKDFVYKLYSADKLKVSESDYDNSTSDGLPGEKSIIEQWDRLNPTTDYVDLNEPILSPRAGGDAHRVDPRYPIIDPRAAYTSSGAATKNGVIGIVDGFDASIVTDKTLQLAESSAPVPYLPMPVKWLYILEDGTIGPASLATTTNPIVGRTAFWTDDESCKLNINTASEGTFWDTPVMSSEAETGRINPDENTDTLQTASNQVTLALACSQPIHGEYQRYPGHPATTCLSPAMGWLWGITPTVSTWPKKDTNYTNYKDGIYRMSPFMPAGKPTTQGGTVNADTYIYKNSTASHTYVSYPGDPNLAIISTDTATKHLYSSIDEMVFKQERFNTGSETPLLNTSIPTGTGTTQVPITPEAIEKMRFFLTANSRAPEVNLFGRPRVTGWPIAANPNLRTSYDDLFLFASTISKGATEASDNRYNIFRSDAKDDTTDFDSQNTKMFKYLQDLTSRSIPGFTTANTSFSSKLKEDRDEVLALIFDYIRCMNLVDTGSASVAGNTFAPYTPRYYKIGSDSTYNDSLRVRSVDWSGQVTPLKINTSANGYAVGMGRFATIREAGLLFYRTTKLVNGVSKPAIQAVLIMDMVTPAAGYPAIRDTYFTTGGVPAKAPQMQITFSASPTPAAANFPTFTDIDKDGWVNINNVSSNEVNEGRGFMPTLGPSAPFQYFAAHKGSTNPTNVNWVANPDLDPARTSAPLIKGKTLDNKATSNQLTNYNPTTSVSVYPYVSDKIEVPASGTFKFSATQFDIAIWSGESFDVPSLTTPGQRRGRKVQTFHLVFPACNGALPLPTLIGSGDFAGRFPGTFEGGNQTILSGDVVRSISITSAMPYAADFRMTMPLVDVPPGVFQPGGEAPTSTFAQYNSSTALVHSMHISHGDFATSGIGGGKYVATSQLSSSKPPLLPPSMSGGVHRLDNASAVGDFDRGISKHTDGPMINKVDEGNLRFEYTQDGSEGVLSYRFPYYHGRNIEETGQSFFSPNRQVSSAVMFGSLPTGVVRGQPWQTLLFRPNRETGTGHPGAANPPDHLLLDLFSLPIIEPYAISEPFSTAGKVNLNYVIAPFGYAKNKDLGSNPGTKNPRSYVRRDTALRGVLRGEFMTAIATNSTSSGHAEDALGGTNIADIGRWPINLNVTLENVETRLKDISNGRQLFRSASEICTVDLYPDAQGGSSTTTPFPSVTNWNTFWNTNFAMTGDNQRERPYAHIYPRLTTKSNIFTVHMRCEAIRKSPHSSVTAFDPKLDQVVGAYRGSATIERFIDPNDPDLASYNLTSNDRVDPYYRYRVINTKLFAPK